MIKVEVIENFTLQRFDEIRNLKRHSNGSGNMLKKRDVFECEKDLADYLLGKNPLNKAVVQVIEVKPEELPTTEEIDKAYEEISKPRKKRTSKK